jgi:hypothetical protein
MKLKFKNILLIAQFLSCAFQMSKAVAPAEQGIYPCASAREWIVYKPDLSQELQNHQLPAVLSTKPTPNFN